MDREIPVSGYKINDWMWWFNAIDLQCVQFLHSKEGLFKFNFKGIILCTCIGMF